MVKSKYSPCNPNGCRFCPKIFCCSDCRDKHENNKHPEPKCFMCVNRNQPFQFKKDTHSSIHTKDKLLWHIAFNHLPVYCKICGETYRTNQEFLSAKPCRGFINHENSRLLEKHPELQTPPHENKVLPINIHDVSKPTAAVNNSNGSAKKSFSTPLIIFSESNRSCIIASHKGQHQRVHDYDSLDSPPVEGENNLLRQTSTPVHGKSDLASLTLKKQANVALLALKDFRTSFKTAANSLAEDSAAANHHNSASLEDHTSSSEIASLKFDSNSCSPADVDSSSSHREKESEVKQSAVPSGIYNTPTTILKKKPMPITTERSILKPEILERLQRDEISGAGSGSSEKRRVRFSDQHLLENLSAKSAGSTNKEQQEVKVAVTASALDNDSSGSDIFFETQDHNMIMNKSSSDAQKKSTASSVATVADSTTSSSVDVFKIDTPPAKVDTEFKSESDLEIQKNNDKVEGDVKKGVREGTYSKADGQYETNKNVEENGKKSSSRVVMMLLVEQSDTTDLSKLDLRPLIDSGLKQLQQITPAPDHRPSEEVSGRKSSSWCSPAEAEVPSQENIRRSSSESFTSSTRRKRSDSMRSQDAYQPMVAKSEGGLFSTVARVVRSALKKLPGPLSMWNLSREQLSTSTAPPPLPGLRRVVRTRTSSISSTTTEIITVGSAQANDLHRQVMLRNSSSMKRRRSDSVDDAIVPSQDSKENIFGIIGSRVPSPAHKRHRSGWYRIKGREPIARMRNLAVNNSSQPQLQNFTFELPSSRPQHQSTQNQE